MEKLVWHNEKKKVNSLIPYEGNPRRLNDKQREFLEKSLTKFNLMSVPVINTDGIIVSGHQRVKVLQLLGRGDEMIDVRIPNRKLTQAEMREANLLDNKTQELGEWDLDLLAGFGEEELLATGWDSSELDGIFGLDIADDFDVEKEFEKAIKEPKGVKVGDVWEMGSHKLLIGDCVDPKNWEKLLGEERFDFMFTDPPYKLAYSKTRVSKIKTKEGIKLKRKRTYLSTGETDKEGKPKGFGYKQDRVYLGVNKRGGVPEYDEWLSIANDFQNPMGANVMIFENWRNTISLWQAIEKYWKIRNQIIWHLPNRHQGFSRPGMFFNKYDIVPLAGEGKLNERYEEELENYLQEKGQKLLDNYEIIVYGNKGKPEWTKIKGKKWWTLGDHITWTAESQAGSGQNIIFGTKPIQILVPYIKILSPRNGIVMEPFAGSGSTIIASEIMKRKCRAIEIEPLYGEVIIRRFEKFANIKATKLK